MIRQTCSLLINSFKKRVHALQSPATHAVSLVVGVSLFARSCWEGSESFFFCSEVSKMVEEDKAGITCYANKASGFRGILKQRYADFIVNEVDCDGKVVHLTCLDAPEEVFDGPNEEAPEDEGLNSLNVEKHIQAFKSISKDGDAELLRSLLNDFLEGKKDENAPIVLAPDSDKLHRTEVHNFFKGRLPFLVTDTVDGPDSKSKCVRVRFLSENATGGRNNGKRMREIRGNRGKSKRQKHDAGGQGFDSRGADNWPSQHGKYVQFHLYKENKDTQDALMVLGKMLRMQPKSFGIAGTKDKRAITTQRVTAFKQPASKLAALNKRLYGIKVGDFCYVDRALVLGQLSGNRFTITLRGVVAESDEVIKEAAVSLGKSGFINYFGLQRFGTSSVPTFTIGAALLRGEWEAAVSLILQPREGERQDVLEARDYFLKTRDADGTLLRMPRQFVTERAVLTGLRKTPGNYLQAINSIPRTMRMMYVHSYQSYLWNHAASRRINLYGVGKVVEGDLVLCKHAKNDTTASKSEVPQEGDNSFSETLDGEEDESDNLVQMELFSNVKHVSADDVSSGDFNINDVVLPLPGSKTLLPANSISCIYEELAKEDSLDLRSSAHNVKEFSFLHLPGSYRRLIQEADDFRWKILKYDDHTRALAETDWDRINKKAKKEVNAEQKEALAAPEMSNSSKEEKISDIPVVQTAVQLEFTLPSSCYATMAIRELLKISSSVAFHKTLSEEGP